MKTLTHDQDVYDSGMAAGVEKGREEGMAAGIDKGRIGQLIELVNDGILPLEVAAKKANMSETDFVKLVGKQ